MQEKGMYLGFVLCIKDDRYDEGMFEMITRSLGVDDFVMCIGDDMFDEDMFRII